jgi:hypothetical protein
MKIQNEQLEVLGYVTKLQGRSVDVLVGEILESWLTDNYADSVETAEQRQGLPTTIVLTRKGTFSPKAHRVMLSNLKQLLA